MNWLHEAEVQTLCVRYMPLARSVAGRVKRLMPSSDYSEIEGYAMEWTLILLRRYDPSTYQPIDQYLRVRLYYNLIERMRLWHQQKFTHRKRYYPQYCGLSDSIMATMAVQESAEDTAIERIVTDRVRQMVDALPDHLRGSAIAAMTPGEMAELARTRGVTQSAICQQVQSLRHKFWRFDPSLD